MLMHLQPMLQGLSTEGYGNKGRGRPSWLLMYEPRLCVRVALPNDLLLLEYNK